MLKVELVPVMLVDSVFGRCADGLGKALSKTKSNMDVAYLYQQCRSGDAMLVIAHDGAETISGAMVLRTENRQGYTAMNTLGLWCSSAKAARGAYKLLETKQFELARSCGCKSLVSGARVPASAKAVSAYQRRYPQAKILYVTLEVELD